MKLKKYLDFRLLGLIGAILLILSQFIPWFSYQTLLDIFIIRTIATIEDSFIYLFPLICGIICMVGTIIIIYNIDYRINSVIVNFIGLGFFLVFAFRIIPEHFLYLPNAPGFYLAIIGSILVFFDILNILLTRDK